MSGRRRPSLMMFAAIFYVGLLLWGTCLSRVDTLRELLTWQRSDFTGFFVNEFSLTSFAPIWHELMNVVLFMPLGFFMMGLHSRAAQCAAAHAYGLL